MEHYSPIYTLRFEAGTEPAIIGTKKELVAELQNLIDRIESIDEEDYTYVETVPLYDTNGVDYVAAIIELN